ncbi:MAG: deoxyribodipyrimidine photo-lyase, partial [Roseivirga sp.]|nr:deoxyribodipyrimidine photo-lyase [Roseivirga sp.]
MSKISFFWFRRDLRFIDNTGLYYALKETKDVLPVFIFDKNILDKLEDKADARVEFIQSTLEAMNNDLASKGSGIKTFYSTPLEAYKQLIDEYEIEAVYTNRDYEPYAKDRDKQVESLLKENNIDFFTFKDQVIYEYEEIVSGSGSFYKVFTPYSKSWKEKYKANRPEIKSSALRFENWAKLKNNKVHSLEDMGFEPTEVKIPSSNVEEEVLKHYDKKRDYPAQDATSRLGIHLRFGTISIRQLAEKAISLNETFLNELIWRDFYAMILANNPKVVDNAFKKEYDQIPWRQDEEGFEKWCKGKTGYPIVDAGMRQLNKTGYMHNRVRMVVA